MNIFQILITDVPPSQEFVDSTKQRILSVYSGCNYTLYNNEMIREFLSSYRKDVLNAYDKLLPYAFKADLARYCLLHKYGGWYFDVSVFPLFKYETQKSGLIFYNPSRKLIENSIMYFKPEHPLMKAVINISINNINNKRYGQNPLDITGPQTLTTAFNSLNIIEKKNVYYATFKCGDSNTSEKWYEIRKLKFSEYKKYEYESGISHLGLLGTNHYHDMWKEKVVYTR